MTEKFISALLDKFEASSIAELDFDDGGSRLVLRKEAAFNRAAPQNFAESRDFSRAGVVDGAHADSAAPDTAARAGGAAAVHLGLPVAAGEAQAAVGGETITSPIVAAFYGSPKPDAPPFVKPGSRVKAGDSLCILEAMKMMNRLEAEFDCEIVSVKAANGDLVEYGQVLFEVKRL
ncbi:MAG: acetyl-CoA carboxylase biotin carboxyl carrier protein [Treponema sp.]|jgi:acetyl-CoA carboxylase biotin carboxyl carrier protein|nr:acetyl-CoA carboxylase biotin carboxyl carrier protein [Treponema sp.]